MTTQQKRAAGIALITFLASAVALPLLGMAWNAKVSTSDYRVDIQRVETAIEKKADKESVTAMLGEIKDIKTILCSKQDNRNDSACIPDRKP